MFFDTMKQDKAEPPTTYEISSEPTQAGTQPQTQQTSEPLENEQADQAMDVDQDVEGWINILEMDTVGPTEASASDKGKGDETQ